MLASPLPSGVSPSPARSSMPQRFFRRPFPCHHRRNISRQRCRPSQRRKDCVKVGSFWTGQYHDGEDILRKMQRLSLFKSLSVVGFCHLQGFVHCDLKPENFLFTTRDEDAPKKVIDFSFQISLDQVKD